MTVQAPSHAIPEKYRDSPDIRTVRIPEQCHSCGTNLSQDNLEWTGPLEARCLYCGAAVKAKFERVQYSV
ncbi:MAG: hypothetical protein GF411_14595 [Candidatus Lokiarchaeota archaeon]|nr:hypothetical protein [Candidatus Lokiarchaeota archaeon]